MSAQTDPLDALLLPHDEAEQLRAAQMRRRLADYLKRMPPELRELFREEYQRKPAARRQEANDEPAS